MDMDISMDIHRKSVDMDMDMDGKFHIHGNPVLITNNKLYMSFQLLPKSTTLDDLERPYRSLLRAHHGFWKKKHKPILSAATV